LITIEKTTLVEINIILQNNEYTVQRDVFYKTALQTDVASRCWSRNGSI